MYKPTTHTKFVTASPQILLIPRHFKPQQHLEVSKRKPSTLDSITMIISRLMSMILRFAQFACAAVVLVLSSYLLHHIHGQHHEHYQLDKQYTDSYGRLIYGVIIAIVSVFASILWLLPTTSHVVNVIGDLLFCGAWWAVFGLLQEWYDGVMSCGSIWAWNAMIVRNGLCSKWNAAQAFSFLSAVLWFASFGLSLVHWRRTGRARDGKA
jgi:hypothetical protein